MAKPIMAPESFVDLPFPVKGVNVATELEHQPAQTTPLGQNVRAFEPSTQRARGGARPGLTEYLPSQVAGIASKIQHLNIIVDPTTAFLLAAQDGGDIPDPSTNNLSLRNPGRFVRRGGSAIQPNRNLKGLGAPKPPPPPGATYSIDFKAHVFRVVGGGNFNPQEDTSSIGPGSGYTQTLTVTAPDGTSFAVTATLIVDGGNNVTSNTVTVSPSSPVNGWFGGGTLTATPI